MSQVTTTSKPSAASNAPPSNSPATSNTSDATAAATTPPLVLAELSARCMGNADLAVDLLGKFAAQLRRDLDDLERSLAIPDATKIAATAHALKGAAAAMSAPGVQGVAAEIEGLARERQLNAVARALGGLRAEAERCIQCLPLATKALRLSPGGDGRPSRAAGGGVR